MLVAVPLYGANEIALRLTHNFNRLMGYVMLPGGPARLKYKFVNVIHGESGDTGVSNVATKNLEFESQ